MKHVDIVGRFFLALVLPLLLSACAGVEVKTIAPPPPTAKLRVYVQAISAELPHGHWQTPHEEFVEKQVAVVERQLRKTGIYELVSDEDVEAALGDQIPTRWQLARNEWALARRIGRAVHADYALIVERGARGGQDYFWETVLVNVESGRDFGVLIPITKTRDRDENRRLFKAAARASYPELFKDAKQDMLTTALRKGRQMSQAAPVALEGEAAATAQADKERRERQGREEAARERAAREQAAAQERERLARVQDAEERRRVQEAERERQAKELAARERAAQDKAAQEKAAQEKAALEKAAQEKAAQEKAAQEAARAKAEAERVAQAREAERAAQQEQSLRGTVVEAEPPAAPGHSRVVKLEQVAQKTAPSSGERIVVYDFEASANYRPVALILSESLREEVSKLEGFQLLNRENLEQVLQEQKLQQSGLIDEKQAVELGKGMAARQIMTGRFGALGRSAVLQAKRVDVETLGVLGMQSLKCPQGEEEQLLDRMPIFARELTRRH